VILDSMKENLIFFLFEVKFDVFGFTFGVE